MCGAKRLAAKCLGAKRQSVQNVTVRNVHRGTLFNDFFSFRKACNENTLVYFPYYVIFNQHTCFLLFYFIMYNTMITLNML